MRARNFKSFIYIIFVVKALDPRFRGLAFDSHSAGHV